MRRGLVAALLFVGMIGGFASGLAHLAHGAHHGPWDHAPACNPRAPHAP